ASLRTSIMTKEDTLKLLKDLNNKISHMTAKEILARAQETNALQHFCDDDSCKFTDENVH
ncbi:hypothetical protein, partial [Treponema vincentii]|uniref:hypothetical protein n=1 Tax=Treponema vincentii TaxID=69710 RepID=UPI003D92AB4B